MVRNPFICWESHFPYPAFSSDRSRADVCVWGMMEETVSREVSPAYVVQQRDKITGDNMTELCNNLFTHVLFFTLRLLP